MQVDPKLVLAARRGFAYCYVENGGGTFQDDDYDRAANFFDDQADDGHWSQEFYESYAKMDPWVRDKDGDYGVKDD